MAGDRRPPRRNGDPGLNGAPEPGNGPGETVRIRPVRGSASAGFTPIRLPDSGAPGSTEAGTEEEGAGSAARERARQLTPHVRVQPREAGEAAFPHAEPWLPAPVPNFPVPNSPAPELPAPTAAPAQAPLPGDEAAQLQRALNDWLRHAPAPGVRAPLAAGEGSSAPALPDSAPSAPAGRPRREVLRVTARAGGVERVGAEPEGDDAARPGAQVAPSAINPEPQAPERVAPASAAPGDDLTPWLEPMYAGVTPVLARFLPRSAPQQLGLLSAFCPLDGYLGHLHGERWSGYLQVGSGQLAAYALLHEGRVVAAATLGGAGEEALGELLTLYGQGGPLAAYPLPPLLAHLLSGVGVRAARPELGPEFTGVYADAEGALLYSRGEVVARVAATLPVAGAFAAPARPPALGLPRSLAGWAYQTYPLTLRGRDVDHPITGVYHEVRAKYGEAGADFVRSLGRGQTPAEYAARSERALPELEKLIQEFTALGLLRAPDA